jgi:nitrate reductase NapAB chaperone NapD
MKPESARYSGILVVTAPAHVDACRRALEELRGVEVHHWHGESGRIVVVHESDSVTEQEERLAEMRSLPHVALAEPVYHYVDTDPTADDSAADGPPEEQVR